MPETRAKTPTTTACITASEADIFIWGSGASGRIRTTDTRIFNPLLYQLSYRGICGGPCAPRFGAPPIGRAAGGCPAPISPAPIPIFGPVFGQVRVGGRAFHPIAFAQPVQKVTILTALTAKWLMLCVFGVAAERTCGGFRIGHGHAHSLQQMNRKPVRSDNRAALPHLPQRQAMRAGH